MSVVGKVSRTVIPGFLRNRFMAVVIYSGTLSPYAKLGASIALFAQPFNVPGPVDFLFYCSLFADGARGVYKDMRGRLDGSSRREKDMAFRRALADFQESVPEKRLHMKPAFRQDAGIVLTNLHVTLPRAQLE